MKKSLSRRDFLSRGAYAAPLACLTIPAPASAAEANSTAEPFGYCLNTSTIRGQKLPLVQEIDIVARAGYNGIEPWVNELDQHVKDGKSLKDLAKLVRDRGLVVADVIAFAEWIVDDDARRRKGFEEAKRIMGMCQEVGSKHMAAPPPRGDRSARSRPTQAPPTATPNCANSANRWTLRPRWRCGDSRKTCLGWARPSSSPMQSGSPKACILPDVYHFYKGGSDPHGLRLLNKDAIAILHVNDYPAKDRAKISDADRVYPGDGVAPLKSIFADLRAIGYRGMLSLEVFNKDYWQKDALVVAMTGLEKMRSAVRASTG